MKVPDSLVELGLFKEMLQGLFFETEDIRKLVMPTTLNPTFTDWENWIGGPYSTNAYGEVEIVRLPGHCLDVPFIEGIVTDTRTFIAMETCLNYTRGDRLKNLSIQIFVYSHREAFRLSVEERKYFKERGYAGNRCDMAAMAINRTLLQKNVRDKFGIGNLIFDEVARPVSTNIPNFDYYGRSLFYNINDFFITPHVKGAYML